MKSKKKPDLSILLGVGKPPPEEEEEAAEQEADDETPDVADAKRAAAEELIEAVKAEDPDRLVDAMQTFHDACMAEKDDSEDEASPDSDDDEDL